MPAVLTQTYAFKSSPLGSHSLLLAMLPQAGEGRSVLDVGCWDGMLSKRLAERGFRVTGIDHVVPHDGAEADGINYIHADLHRGLPALRTQFDYIVCADVLEHLLDPLLVLKQLRQHLKPDGILIASLPNSGHLYFRLMVLSGRFPKSEKGLFDRTHIHFFTFDGWKDLFDRAGYTMTQCQVTSVPVGILFGGDTPLSRGLERMSWMLARIWKRLFAYQFVVTGHHGSPSV